MSVRILQGDCLDVMKILPDESVHCAVTSPPYWGLRDYSCAGQLGLEPTPQAYVENMVAVFREVRRVLRDDGTLWLNLGDSYCAAPNSGTGWESSALTKPNGRPRRAQIAQMASMRSGRDFGDLKPKDLVGVPWMIAFALRADGWYLRQDIIWQKPNPMPESVRDRCTKAHEYLFMLAKSERYYYDNDAVREPYAEDTFSRAQYGWPHLGNRIQKHQPGRPARDEGDYQELNERGRNKRSVWTVTTQPFKAAHFATFPPALIEPCILAGCPVGGTVLDPFGGAGTTGLVADRYGRDAILIELNPEYIAIAERRIKQAALHEPLPLPFG